MSLLNDPAENEPVAFDLLQRRHFDALPAHSGESSQTVRGVESEALALLALAHSPWLCKGAAASNGARAPEVRPRRVNTLFSHA